MSGEQGPGIRTYVLAIAVIAILSIAALALTGGDVSVILSTRSGTV